MNCEPTLISNQSRHGLGRAFWIGLAVTLSYLGLVTNGFLFRNLAPQPLGDFAVIVRELINLGMVVLIAWVVIRIEKCSLQSVGIFWRRSWLKTMAWSIAVAAVCFITAILLMVAIQFMGTTYGKANPFSQLSLWTVTLITIRAGVAEEFMMRGYLLTRIEKWTGSTRIAVALTLIPFALLHYTQGPAGVLISFVLGGILTVFFIWKRDLITNMIAHFLVDFVANVGLPILEHVFGSGQ